jgi:hypothetical protein
MLREPHVPALAKLLAARGLAPIAVQRRPKRGFDEGEP